jgi:5-formyltetrahydrofolate cyclo-ligase
MIEKGLREQIAKQIRESEEETKQYEQEEANENISNCLARLKQKKTPFKVSFFHTQQKRSEQHALKCCKLKRGLRVLNSILDYSIKANNNTHFKV